MRNKVHLYGHRKAAKRDWSASQNEQRLASLDIAAALQHPAVAGLWWGHRVDEVGSDDDGSVASLFRSGLPVAAKLERARAELLDLSARNRLLNMPRSARAAKVLEIVDERSDEVFRMLVGEGRPFTFLAGKSGPDDEDDTGGEVAGTVEVATPLEQPADEELDARGVAARHSDTRLQTRLTSTGLQKRLLAGC